MFSSDKNKGKKKGKKNEKELKNQDDNKLIGIEFFSHSIKGTGTKKLENQDSFTIIDTQAPEYYFFAVLDGHGSSGREGRIAVISADPLASSAACDNF